MIYILKQRFLQREKCSDNFLSDGIGVSWKQTHKADLEFLTELSFKDCSQTFM